MATVIGSMPRPRPPHLHREPLKRGEARWYVRIGHGPRTRIRERYGTPEFDAAYQAALRGETPLERPGKAKGGTLQWLWDRYRDSSKWASLSNATRRQRENIMRHVLKNAGRAPLAEIAGLKLSRGERKSENTIASEQLPRHIARLVQMGGECRACEKGPRRKASRTSPARRQRAFIHGPGRR